MLKSSVNVDRRNEVGSNASNKIRNQGHIPAVIYGPNIKAQSIEIDKREISSILRHYGTSVLLDIEVGDKTVMTMVKDIQRDPVNRDIIHVDFQAVSYNTPINATVPIVLKDRDKVENSEATIQNQIRELHIECLPQDIPESIEISLKDLAIGHPLKVEDIELSEDIIILNDPEEVIASLTHVAREVEENDGEEPQTDDLNNDKFTI